MSSSIRPLHLAATATALTAVCAPAIAEITHVPLFRYHGESTELFGLWVNDAGDVNNDGVPDVAVYSHDDAVGHDIARIFSCADGSELLRFDGILNDPSFGKPLGGVGDVNGDGFGDVVVGDSLANAAYVFSGSDSSVLFTFLGDDPDDQFGNSVSGAGDVDNDGVADVIVGAAGDPAMHAGYARVFSGTDGSVLFTFLGDAAGDRFGAAVSAAGDVNDDGFDDVVVGAPGEGVDDRGVVRVFSGDDGAVLHTFHGDAADNQLGFSVSGAGDVNNDGFNDVIAGTGLQQQGVSGYARVFSGADGAVLFTFAGELGGGFDGVDVSGAGDVNADGFADLITGSIEFGPEPDARVFSGADGSELFSHEPVCCLPLHPSVTGVGDVNGDGIADFVIGGPESYVGGGHAQLFVSLVLGPDCLADVNGDLTVDVLDLLALLAAWGATSGPEDINGDGIVNVLDLLELLAAWGPCPG